MLFRGAQTFLLFLYAALPLLAFAYALYARLRHKRLWPMASFVFSCMAGCAIGLGLLLLNRKLMDGHFRTTEYLRAVYVAIAALCLLKFLDHWLLRGLFRLGRIPLDAFGRPSLPNAPRALLLLFVQRLLMLAVVIAYAFSLLLSYRPRATLAISPDRATNSGVAATPDDGKNPLHHADVAFSSADGLALRGWWIAAGEMPSLLDAEIAARWGKRTVLLCHGVGSGKEHLLPLADTLSARGFNVFLFDFRAHGQSAGNFISYGDRERFDVLGAARWIKANHRDEAARLFGLGVNTGAAALVGASTDPTDDQLLDGLVLYEPFARFDAVVDATARLLPRGIHWMVEHLSVPLAGLHGGSNLASFAPADAIDQLWPRPLLVVHGQGETFVPNLQSMELFQRANYPKEQFWPADNYYERLRRQRERSLSGSADTLTEMFREFIGTSDLLLQDPGVLHRTLRFLHEAEPSPVI